MPSFGPKTPLRDAVEYALRNGGKRFRPAIVYLVAEALGKPFSVTDAALSIEYFHTASLVADDLPCMDDDDERREKPALHKAFDEATALLATYALISAGYDRIRLAAELHEDPRVLSLAIESASKNTGILGASGGQYLDLYPPQIDEMTLLQAIDLKTGTLFEISFVFGWVFGGGDLNQLNLVKRAALGFGRAFQISDDFLDLAEDQHGMNYPQVAGRERARELMLSELTAYEEALKKLRLESPELLGLAQLVKARLVQTEAVSAAP